MAKKGSLEIIFTAKTHKDGVPFRAIITEKRTWQVEISKFLQQNLSGLKVTDPFLVKNSDEVIELFRKSESPSEEVFALSVDAQDLFYSIPQQEIIRVVRDAIEESDPLSFHSSSGLSTESFLELLSVYLANTDVSFNDQVFIQREGVCIGSSIAPILSTLFLAVREEMPAAPNESRRN